MKKVFVFLLAVLMGAVFISCAKDETEETETLSSESTFQEAGQTEQADSGEQLSREEREDTSETTESTVSAAVNKNEKRGRELTEAVKEALGSEEGAEVDGAVETGAFTYCYIRDEKEVYSEEYSEEGERNARNNADAFIKNLSSFFTDISFDHMEIKKIGSEGENGTDSVRYVFYYNNSSGRQMQIQVDSDGIISYVNSEITW